MSPNVLDQQHYHIWQHLWHLTCSFSSFEVHIGWWAHTLSVDTSGADAQPTSMVDWNESCLSLPLLHGSQLPFYSRWVCCLKMITCLSNTYYLATSIDVERLFSKGWLILFYVRNRLSAGTIRELLCLNNWSTQDLVKMEVLNRCLTIVWVVGENQMFFNQC